MMCIQYILTGISAYIVKFSMISAYATGEILYFYSLGGGSEASVFRIGVL
jgi:hypothetical protein